MRSADRMQDTLFAVSSLESMYRRTIPFALCATFLT
jgi:hypothetical protein